MDRFILLLLAGIVAGFALIEVAAALTGAFAGLATIITWIGVIAVIVFSIFLIVKALLAIFHHHHK
ncbi:hypothetical protein E2R51_12985 [Jeotgalibacillus sp. S-D1]|uniref:hypothetical protein n=1 Tax=Jeotgalibacillus sp. S-D1 TaxID=2552189 RepID=UPI00105A55E7|nr:hypothetical protein [Jeotgalibacillus sp. S-D1]TDL31284.1 hypothetical protein E2R51_12985 [Jeotgalibacillus sp. S-D1]